MGFLNKDEVNEMKGNKSLSIISFPNEKYEVNEMKGNKSLGVIPFPNEKNEKIEIDYDKVIPENEKVQMNRKISINPELYSDFTNELYPYSLNFYDFEVFAYDWCVTIINPIQNIETIIVNDSDALKSYYNNHKNEIWVGYNSRNYDTFIMKSILLGINPKKTNGIF